MKFYWILSIFFVGLSAFLIPPKSLNKCGLDESLGIILCVEPVLSQVQSNISLGNLTRARGIRIVDDCRNATTCLTQYPCVTGVQLDKILNLACDAFSYFSTEFAACQKKIQAQMPPCIRKVVNDDLWKTEKMAPSCDQFSQQLTCVKTEITEICGERYWKPLEEMAQRLQKYAQIKCPDWSTSGSEK